MPGSTLEDLRKENEQLKRELAEYKKMTERLEIMYCMKCGIKHFGKFNLCKECYEKQKALRNYAIKSEAGKAHKHKDVPPINANLNNIGKVGNRVNPFNDSKYKLSTNGIKNKLKTYDDFEKDKRAKGYHSESEESD